jgi:ribonuclease D
MTSTSCIETSAELEGLLSAHRGHEQVAVDTEFRRRDTFYPQVALLQLCWGGAAYLVDPLQLDELDALRGFLTDPAQIKCLHSASEDLEVFEHWLQVLPSPLFDTQRAAALLGLGGGLGYRAIVAQFFEVDLPKEETQSDWLQRPLTPSQAEYAAQDVSYLYPIGVQLLERAEAMGRKGWILEEGARMTPGGKPPLSKFKTAYRLPPKQQAVLAAVVNWRETEARQLDRPRSWILNDKLVMALAQAMPASITDLHRIEGMPAGFVRRAGDKLLAQIALAEAAPDAAMHKDIVVPLSRTDREVLSRLSERLKSLAETLQVPPEVLMPKSELERLIRQRSEPTLESLAAWSGWREAAVIDPLRQLLLEEA